jgi:predicted metal-dependent hydrolase
MRSEPVTRPAVRPASPAPREISAASPPRPTLVPHPDAPRLELLRRLNRLTAGRLRSLSLTDNRRTILSVSPDRSLDGSPRLSLRIHRSFVEAPDEVIRAVAEFLGSRKGSEKARQALAVIREHFSRHRPETGRKRRPALHPEGVTLDLREVAADLNRRYFEGRLSAEITWGRAAAGSAGHRCRSRSLQLGSYSYEDNLIRLHRVLDHPSVPRYVVEAVVYHELLHADMPPVVQGGRRFFHTPEFRRRERRFRHHDRANAWILENLPELLRARRRRS